VSLFPPTALIAAHSSHPWLRLLNKLPYTWSTACIAVEGD
jgi:hypothetical protein